MGPTDATKCFSRIMIMVLGDLVFVVVYLDDITIFSSTLDDHFQHLEIVLQRLKKADLKLNMDKCVWCAKSVKLLGHIVSSKGIQMDPAKIEAIVERAPPKNIRQLQEFLGLSNY